MLFGIINNIIIFAPALSTPARARSPNNVYRFVALGRPGNDFEERSKMLSGRAKLLMRAWKACR
jgi:hypothetical protein